MIIARAGGCVAACGVPSRFALRDDRTTARRNRPLISVSRLRQALVGAAPVVCPCIAECGWSRQRVIGLVRRRAGLPMMTGEISVCLYAA
jgi:hypothetical protein